MILFVQRDQEVSILSFSMQTIFNLTIVVFLLYVHAFTRVPWSLGYHAIHGEHMTPFTQKDHGVAYLILYLSFAIHQRSYHGSLLLLYVRKSQEVVKKEEEKTPCVEEDHLVTRWCGGRISSFLRRPLSATQCDPCPRCADLT